MSYRTNEISGIFLWLTIPGEKAPWRVTTLFRFAVGDKAASSSACFGPRDGQSPMMPLSSILYPLSADMHLSGQTGFLSLSIFCLFLERPNLKANLTENIFFFLITFVVQKIQI